MVYKIFSDAYTGPNIRTQQTRLRDDWRFAKFIIKTVKCILFIYDILSLWIYFIIQRPDARAKEAQRTRSERVDINTWIKTDQNPTETSYLLHGSESKAPRNQRCPSKHKYMGSTLSEIFSNAVHEYSSRPCLGYRAVVTCPVMVLNDEGKHVMEEKSFRSDYTWYTYEQIGRRVQDIASGLYHYSIYPRSRVLFLASTSLEWFCASQACFQLAAELIVAPEIIDIASLRLILKETATCVIFASCDKINLLSDLLRTLPEGGNGSAFCLEKIVLIDWLFAVDYSEPAFAKLRDCCKHVVREILSLGHVEEMGVEKPIELSCSGTLDSEKIPDLYLRKLEADLKSTTNDVKAKANAIPTRKKRSNSLSGYSSLNADLDKQSCSRLERSKQVHTSYRKLNASDYTVTNEHQLDLKSSSPGTYLHDLRKLNNKAGPRASDLAMIVYTLGSLAQLKAIMLTHSYLSRSNHYLFLDGMVRGQDIHCTTLSLDNVIEFMTEMCVFSHGGSIGYSCNQNTLFYDGKELFKRDKSDLATLNPTFLLVRPYILERLRASVQNYLNLQLNPLVSFMLTNILYDYKKFWAHRHFGTPIVDRIFSSELKKLFGSNLKYILCNGATDCSETKDFFAFMLNIPVIELYGPDESVVSMISVNDIWDYKRRHRSRGWSEDEDLDEKLEDYEDMQLMFPKVNRNTFKLDNSKNLLITSSIHCPTLGTRIRLEDWEDFRTSDRPYPRGRVIIGGEGVCKGYFKRDSMAKECFYTDTNLITWFRTDDIARVFPNGSFEIISGLSDMIRMMDGQFISLSQIEHILRNSQFVENVCAICGDDRKFVVALVVPNLRRLALKSMGEADLKMAIGPGEPEPEELADMEFRREVCNDRLLCEFVSDHLSELIAAAGFHSIPKRFHLVPEIWTPEIELVTPSYEPKRNAIQKYYATYLQSIFKMEFERANARLSGRVVRKRNISGPVRTKVSY